MQRLSEDESIYLNTVRGSTAKVRFEYGDGYSQTTATENRCRRPKR